MWYLTSDGDNRVIYITSQSQQVVIGRSADNQQCNFAIANDPSISRKHATLSIRDNVLYLQDVGSRYGTFINNAVDKVEVNTDIQLKINDVVKFGKMNCVWKVNAITLNTCTSTLKGESLINLKVTLSKLGGVLKNEWDETCNYLTMPSITLTIKVVLALVQGSHIVTPEYWLNFLERVNNFLAVPEPQNFLPEVTESTLNKEIVSFLPDVQRQSLFKDKKFIFFSKRQYEMYKPVLIKSGASPLLLTNCKFTMTMLCEQNTIVIQYIASGTTQDENSMKNQINDITTHLKSKGKRVVADAEIGLAILYSSTDKYCNPSFSFTSEVVKQNEQVCKTSKVLAPESQESTVGREDNKNMKINETYDDKNDLDLNNETREGKRKLSEFTSEIQFNPNKKVAISSYTADIPNESNKRKLSAEESTQKPSKKMTIEKENINQVSSDNSVDSKSNGMFNFLNDKQSDSENKNKKLNLARPQKRKQDASREDDDLFNFVQTNDNVLESDGECSKRSIFGSNKIKRGDSVDTPNVISPINNKVTVTPEDISAMRGIKLKELMESNKITAEEYHIKQETDELEEKMSGLDLGNTIVIVCNNLIVKKESFVADSGDNLSSVKNFKKFKKVWPVRRQEPVILNTTRNITDLNEPMRDRKSVV